MPLNAPLDYGTVVTEAPILGYGLVFEDDAPDGDAGASQGWEEEGLRVEGSGEVGVLGEKVREGQRTGQTGGKAESVERVGRGKRGRGEEGERGEIVGENGAF